MPHDFRALCQDFYVNQRVNLRMDLPTRRETVLSMFDRVRRQLPSMNRFRRYRNELALESAPDENGGQEWLALRKTSIRSGSVNPANIDEAYRLHALVLELAPYFLDVSPLDLESVELLYGFDIPAAGNHDEIVFDALLRGSPLHALSETGRMVGFAPLLSFRGRLDPNGGDKEIEAHFEVKTRGSRTDDERPEPGGDGKETADPAAATGAEGPISVYLTVRSVGAITDGKDLPGLLETLSTAGERLVAERVVPDLVGPIRRTIGGEP